MCMAYIGGNDKTLLKDIKEKWSALMGRKTDFTKVSMLRKFPYKLNRILIRILAEFFLELDEFNLKFIWKNKWSAKTTTVEKVQERGICPAGRKALTAISEIKAVLCWLKGGQMDRQTERQGQTHTSRPRPWDRWGQLTGSGGGRAPQ